MASKTWHSQWRIATSEIVFVHISILQTVAMARTNLEGDLILAIFHLIAICSWGSFGKISWKTWNPGKCFSDSPLIWKSKSLFRVFLKTSFYIIFFLVKKLKRNSWIKLCPKIIMWSMYFLSSSIKIVTQLQWRKDGKSECIFFMRCLWCHGFRDDNAMRTITLRCYWRLVRELNYFKVMDSK